jgi:mono/diheme cytochrome c family protein
MLKKMSVLAKLTLMAVVISMMGLSRTTARADNTAEATYKAKCASCHGPDGKGETAAGKAMKVKDLASADVQKMSDAELSDSITKGKGKMPASKTLTPDQVKDLIAYVRAFGKKK